MPRCHSSKQDSSTLVAPPFGSTSWMCLKRGRRERMERAAPNLVAYHKQTMQFTGELMGAGCDASALAGVLEAHNPKLRALDGLVTVRGARHQQDRHAQPNLRRRRTFFDDYDGAWATLHQHGRHAPFAGTDGASPALGRSRTSLRGGDIAAHGRRVRPRARPGPSARGARRKEAGRAAFGVLDFRGHEAFLVEAAVVNPLTSDPAARPAAAGARHQGRRVCDQETTIEGSRADSRAGH